MRLPLNFKLTHKGTLKGAHKGDLRGSLKGARKGTLKGALMGFYKGSGSRVFSWLAAAPNLKFPAACLKP